MADVTYFVDVHTNLAEWNNEGDAFDGNDATFADENAGSRELQGDESTCPGVNLGAITKVEVALLSNGDGNDTMGIGDATEPVAGAYIGECLPPGVKGTSNWLTMPVRWHSWTGIEDFSTVGAIGQLEFIKVNDGKGNDINIYKVYIKVTYNPAGPGWTGEADAIVNPGSVNNIDVANIASIDTIA